MSLVLRFAEWPEADKAMWACLRAQGGPLDDQGRFAGLRETSCRTLQAHYGRWLAWIASAEPDALAEPPTQRGTVERFRRWLDALLHVRPMTKLSFVGDTLRMLIAAAPEQDWSMQKRLKATLKRAARHGDASRKAGRILSSDVLLAAGIRHATIEAEAATTELETMKRRRNGTMIAMLALMPMRRRAYARLEIGSSIVIGTDGMLVALPGDLTKNGLPWEAEVPSQVAPLLRTYITTVRPWFMARGSARHSVLWVGDRGSPFADDHLGTKIAGITKRLTGVRVPPHFFRDAAATTLSRMSPQAAMLIRPILAHSSFGTAERHYIHAQTIDAGRDYARLVKQLKRTSL